LNCIPFLLFFLSEKYITLIFYSGFIFCIIFMDITSIELIRTLICFIYNFRIPRRSGHILNSREPNESYCGKNQCIAGQVHYLSNLCQRRAKVKTKHDRAELRMRALQFTADRGVSYSRQFRGKNLTNIQFSSSNERNSTPRSSTFVVEPLIE
jgi:hypothetical protein